MLRQDGSGKPQPQTGFGWKKFFREIAMENLVFFKRSPRRALLREGKCLELTRNNMKKHHKPRTHQTEGRLGSVLQKRGNSRK